MKSKIIIGIIAAVAVAGGLSQCHRLSLLVPEKLASYTIIKTE